MTSEAENSDQTRKKLISEARKVYEADGFNEAALADIVLGAEVTMGALRQHFGDERGLFTAVAEELEKEIHSIVTARISGIVDDWERLERVIISKMELCSRADIQRIIFQDALEVVGMNEWRKIEMKYAFGLIHEIIVDMCARKQTISVAPEMLARTLLGAIIEATYAVAHSNNRALALAEARETLRTLLKSIKFSQMI